MQPQISLKESESYSSVTESDKEEAWGSIGMQDFNTFDIFDDKWINDTLRPSNSGVGKASQSNQRNNNGRPGDIRGAGRVGNDSVRENFRANHEEEKKEVPLKNSQQSENILLKGPMDLQDFEDLMK